MARRLSKFAAIAVLFLLFAACGTAAPAIPLTDAQAALAAVLNAECEFISELEKVSGSRREMAYMFRDPSGLQFVVTSVSEGESVRLESDYFCKLVEFYSFDIESRLNQAEIESWELTETGYEIKVKDYTQFDEAASAVSSIFRIVDFLPTIKDAGTKYTIEFIQPFEVKVFMKASQLFTQESEYALVGSFAFPKEGENMPRRGSISLRLNENMINNMGSGLMPYKSCISVFSRRWSMLTEQEIRDHLDNRLTEEDRPWIDLAWELLAC